MTDRLDDAIELLKTPPAVSVEARVMAEIRQMAVPMTVRPVRVTRILPWLGLALAAGVAAVLFLPSRNPQGPMRASEGIAQFVGQFPGARSVE
ncbi:MAG TPA: hypothetical protein VN803_01925, partial [Gemmatimonadales bacterium]|nr:hypothetical protein [Gemmatimonadales bacterium]